MLALKTFHQSHEHIVTLTNHQNVINVYQNKASIVWSFENTRVRSTGCHTKLLFEKSSDVFSALKVVLEEKAQHMDKTHETKTRYIYSYTYILYIHISYTDTHVGRQRNRYTT